MADTSTLNLKCSIYPIRDFSVDDFLYGYTVATSPQDNDSNYIPFNEQTYDKIIMAGLRPYRKFSDVGNADLTDAIQSIVNRGGTDVYVSSAEIFNVFRQNVSLVKQDRILQENYFDCDNPVFDDIPVTTLPNQNKDDAKSEDLRYFNVWSSFLNTAGGQDLDVTLTDGTNTVTYTYKRTGGSIEWNQSWGEATLAYVYDVDSSASVGAGVETNAFKSVNRLLQSYLKKIAFGVSASDSDILGEEEKLKYTTRKLSFSFNTEFQTFSDLNQFQSDTLGGRFGVLIYEDGATITQDLENSISSPLIADFSGCLFYGYCEFSGFNLETNEIEWNAYRYQIPKTANFMNYVKSSNVVNNSEFTSNATGWTANGGVTLNYDSTSKNLDVSNIDTSGTDYISIAVTTAGFSQDKWGLEFDILDYVAGSATVKVVIRDSADTYDVFSVEITGSGHYSYINELSSTDLINKTEIQCTSSGTSPTFTIDNFRVWGIG